MSVAAAHNFIDRYMRAISARSAELGKPVRCAGPGCFACCREPVYAEYDEAKWLVASLGMEAMLRVRERTRVWWKIFFDSGLNLMPHPDKKNPTNFATLFRYRQAMAWCPVLEDGRCTAYKARPVSCRMHAVVGSPKRCEEDDKRPKQKYMNTAEELHYVEHATALMCDNAPQALLEYDHLGIWLGHILLGETERSRAGRSILVKQTDPQDMVTQLAT